MWQSLGKGLCQAQGRHVPLICIIGSSLSAAEPWFFESMISIWIKLSVVVPYCWIHDIDLIDRCSCFLLHHFDMYMLVFCCAKLTWNHNIKQCLLLRCILFETLILVNFNISIWIQYRSSKEDAVCKHILETGSSLHQIGNFTFSQNSSVCVNWTC